jgi:hypothetical protein
MALEYEKTPRVYEHTTPTPEDIVLSVGRKMSEASRRSREGVIHHFSSQWAIRGIFHWRRESAVQLLAMNPVNGKSEIAALKALLGENVGCLYLSRASLIARIMSDDGLDNFEFGEHNGAQTLRIPLKDGKFFYELKVRDSGSAKNNFDAVQPNISHGIYSGKARQ